MFEIAEGKCKNAIVINWHRTAPKQKNTNKKLFKIQWKQQSTKNILVNWLLRLDSEVLMNSVLFPMAKRICVNLFFSSRFFFIRCFFYFSRTNQFPLFFCLTLGTRCCCRRKPLTIYTLGKNFSNRKCFYFVDFVVG